VPRKRALIGGAVGAGLNLIMEGHRHHALLPVPQAFAPEDAQGSSRVLCPGAASTSGRPAAAGTAAVSQSQHGILAHLYRHSVEVDALVRIEVRCVRWLLLGDERTRL
jgi:E3 ubiquitin-protein ligase BOI-like protein